MTHSPRRAGPARPSLASRAAHPLALAAAFLLTPLAPALASGPAQPETIAQVSESLWQGALHGKGDASFDESLRALPSGPDAGAATAIKNSYEALEASIAKREAARAAQTAKLEAELTETLSGDRAPLTLSKALKLSVELFMLAADKVAFVQQPRIVTLIGEAETAARAAEASSDWIMASELFARLNLLLEEDGRFKADIRRVADRLSMIRLYAPERLWTLRNDRRLLEKLKPLPPYNALGEDFRAKLNGITSTSVLTAMLRASQDHIDRKPLAGLVSGGLESLRTLATTPDLHAPFPTLADEFKRRTFLDFLEARAARLRDAKAPLDAFELQNVLADLLAVNRTTINLPENAVLHEFGNGAFDRLDEFSAIIWPDEYPRFRRLLEGNFTGVGIEIRLDEELQMIKVARPLEGTPAFKAGVRPGDLIKKINGESAVGMNIDQAVEQITGRPDTKVQLTMEREGQDVEVDMVRKRIPIRTVKGWKRAGPQEDNWDWFIDPDQQIGYVRLTGFQEATTTELHQALGQMKGQGIKGLILDLRFNPGGLLTQAVSVANSFVESGTIVYTEAAGGKLTDTQSAKAANVALRDVPIVVLINEGSASASEIVSGALRYYADQGKIRCVLVGKRTYGKGSVQNVVQLSHDTLMKLTMQYYFLPDNRLIHRLEHATVWGVDPHWDVEMLPKQIGDALTLRQEVDSVYPGGPPPLPLPVLPGEEPRGPLDADRLITEGLDLQLQSALFLLRSQSLAANSAPAAPAKAG